MQDLLTPGETCLTFDRETHDGLTETDVTCCTSEVDVYLEFLKNPSHNRLVGQTGQRRLREVMWSVDKPECVSSLKEFMEKHYG